MATVDDYKGPAISPALVILICIAAAIILVVISAAVYRLCRQARASAAEDVDSQTWNPNRRNKDQDKYMEEVRWRNNANAWWYASELPQEYRKGWFRNHVKEQRNRGQVGGRPAGINQTDESGGTNSSHDNVVSSAEEFSSHIDDNPYQELLGRRMRESQIRNRGFAPETKRQTIRLDPSTQQLPIFRGEATENMTFDFDRNQSNDPGVKITINDESDDIVEADLPNKFAPRSSRLFRSSSVYSGDGQSVILPSDHLHLVQSSSRYAL